MESLFLNVLNLGFSATFLVLAVLLLRLIFKKAPKWIFCLLWGLVALRLICPFSIESSLSLQPSAQPLPAEILHTARPQIQTGLPMVDATVNPVLEETLTPEPGASANPTQVWSYVLARLWAVGAGGMLLYALISMLLLRHRVAEATRFQGNLFQSERVASPFVLGLFRPRIYLPYHLSGEELYSVVAHERAHIRRGDPWWKFLGFVLLAVYWFHPLIWLSYWLFCRDMEAACDERVIRSMDKPQRQAYSTALLNCSIRRNPLSACPLAFGEVGVKDRIKSIMQYQKPAFWVILTALIASGIAALCLLTVPAGEKDRLYLEDRDTPGDRNVFEYRIVLGKAIGSGTLWAEAWTQGECVQSAPVAMTQQVASAELMLSVRREGNTPVGVDVQITTDQYGGSLLTYFPFPAGYTPMGWACTGYELNEKIALAPETEKILAVLVFDLGSGVRVFDCETLQREPERLQQADHAIVIRANFSAKGLGSATETIVGPQEVTTGTIYVPWQCLYMHPLSSYAPIGGDSGYRYLLGDKTFSVLSRGGNDAPLFDGTDTAGSDAVTEEIPLGEWLPFPYNEEPWKDLYRQAGFGEPGKLTQLYKELFYQPLDGRKCLFLADGTLMLGEFRQDKAENDYLWSLYSLVPEQAMGVAQWEFAPLLSSRSPAFPFAFDMPYTHISAACEGGQLTDLAMPEAKTDVAMTYEAGQKLWWLPVNGLGNTVSNGTVRFTVFNGEKPLCSGTLYLHAEGGSGGRRVYTASLVGTGLHLSPAPETEGGILTRTEGEQTPSAVTEYDLRMGPLEIPAEELPGYVFFTNSTQIKVTALGEMPEENRLILKDISQGNDEIAAARLQETERQVRFTGLTAARRYRIGSEGMQGCLLRIEG